MTSTKFTPQQHGDNSERVKPSDLINTVLAVQVVSYDPAWKTKFSPEGKPAVVLNVASVSSGKAALNQKWGNDAIVDSLRPYVGSTIICKLETKAGNSGYRYITVVAVSDAEQEQGDKFLADNPTIFANNAVPEPVAAGHW